MRSKWFVAGMLVLMIFIGGCETTKGFAKDVKNTWTNAKGFDEWFKENLW